MSKDAKKDEKRTCIRCFYVAPKEDKYCIRCGAPLINRCTKKKTPLHKGCSKINGSDAIYCADCGSPTTFREFGLL